MKKNVIIILSIFICMTVLMPIVSSNYIQGQDVNQDISISNDVLDFIDGYQRRYYRYVEEFYKAYYENLYPDLESLVGRLNLLRWSIRASWAPPQYALYYAKTLEEHHQYERLLATRIHLLLTKGFLSYAYYYYAPDVKLWRDACYIEAILQGFEVVLDAVDAAEYYWERTMKWAMEVWANRTIELDDSEMDKMFTEVYYIINREDKTEFNYENLNVHQREPYLDYFFEARFEEIRNNIAETLEKIRSFDYDTVNCQMDVGAYVKNYFGD